ncbi:MAG: DUF6527 family protein [Terriglobales bacterium]
MNKVWESNANPKYLAFECPGCGSIHAVPVEGPSPSWTWNVSMDSPTFAPSLLVTYLANPNAIEQFKEWRKERRCHSFVRNGSIQFLADCTHKLAGQTVPLPEVKP